MCSRLGHLLEAIDLHLGVPEAVPPGPRIIDDVEEVQDGVEPIGQRDGMAQRRIGMD